MLLILLEWLLIFFLSSGFGLWTCRLFSLEKYSFFIAQILGFFSLTLISTFWAAVFPIDFTFFLILIVVSALGWFTNQNAVKECFVDLVFHWNKWSTPTKMLFVVFFFLVLMQSSTMPYIPDNESYYRQTINWLNQYGLVKGLANLHIFLAQISGWHILQSSLNLSFVFPELLNDLNGYFFILFVPFSFNLFSDFSQKNKISSIIFASFLLSSVFLFQFINTPSPDLPVYLLSVYVFYLFHKIYTSDSLEEKAFVVLFFSVLFMILIKVTIAPLLILPLFLLYKKNSIYKKQLFFLFAFSSLSLASFMLRNHIISGYMLYPISYFSIYTDWQVPIDLFKKVIWVGFGEVSQLQKINLWIFSSILDGVFNVLIILSLFVAPFFIRKANRAFFWIYLYCFIQFIVLYFTSPQYRFFFPLLLILVPFIGFNFLKTIFKNWQIYSVRIFVFILSYSIGVLIILLFVNSSLSYLTDNRLMKRNNIIFSLDYLIKPHTNSKYDFKSERIIKDNIYFNSPILDMGHFWTTGNVDLPA